jgi:hypothetical protein
VQAGSWGRGEGQYTTAALGTASAGLAADSAGSASSGRVRPDALVQWMGQSDYLTGMPLLE